MAKKLRTTVLGLTGPSDIRTITTSHGKLLHALQQNNSVQLDLTQSVDPDLTFVQLIEAARRFAAATGRAFALSQPATGPLYDVLERGGFLAATECRAFWLHETGEN